MVCRFKRHTHPTEELSHSNLELGDNPLFLHTKQNVFLPLVLIIIEIFR